MFLAHGVLIATWAPHIPSVKAKFGLSDGGLGIALLFLAVGAVVAMLVAGSVASRLGADVVTRWTTVAMAASLLLPLAAPTTATLGVSLVLFGAAIGSMDVAMNAVAAEVETRYARPIMSSFHGMFSVGALVGSLLAAALIRAGISPLVQATAIAALITVGVWPMLRRLPASQKTVESLPRIRFPHGRLLVLGGIAFAVMLAEGSVIDWSATYLRDNLGSTGAVAALAYASFSLAMAVGRFTGDTINRRLGPVPVARIGVVLAVAGLGLGLAVGTPLSMIVGFAFMGAGLANVIPIIFSASAAIGSTPAEGISGSVTLGYVGFLAGPPAIGAIAELSSLTVGFLFVAALLVLATFAAPALNRPAFNPDRRP